ncbi:MAG TPA: energy transducer TonB [Aridibacter sp.]|nr:energy transducer TonB [Aridibacter sp.]
MKKSFAIVLGISLFLIVHDCTAQIDLGGIEPRPYSVIVYDCIGCEGLAERLPAPDYGYVGAGVDVWTGFVFVEVSIDEEGRVVSANAISGHNFFRKRFEIAARNAKFRSAVPNSDTTRSKKIIKYLVIGKNGLKPLESKPLGIINGLAVMLPAPEIGAKAEEVCAEGPVDIRVTLDKHGNVATADPIIGDPLLIGSSVEAAKRARFRRSAHVFLNEGIIRYNYPLSARCARLGASVPVQSLEIKIPSPEVPAECNCLGKVEIEVVLDPNSHRPVRARAVSGLPLLRPYAERAAMIGTYSVSGDVRFEGLLKHNLKVVFFNSPENTGKGGCKRGSTVGHYPPGTKPIEVAEMEISETAKSANFTGEIHVSVLVDEEGKVISAQVVSGNSALYDSAELAAMKFRWKPNLIGGCPVRVRTTIVFRVKNRQE